MKNESLFSLTSQLLSNKGILWVGADSEVPSPALRPFLNAIRFVSYAEFKIQKSRKPYPVMVLSLTDPGLSIDLNFITLLLAEPASEKFLVIHGSSDDTLSDQIIELINSCDFSNILFCPKQDSVLSDILSQAIAETSKLKNFLQPSKKDTDKRISQTKALVRFVKELSTVAKVEVLMSLLKNEVKSFLKVKEPILAFARGQSEFILLYFQGSQLVEKVVSGVWPQQMLLRLNDVNDSQYLANIFGRPFGKLLSIPLKLKRKSNHDPLPVSAVLFFEHALSSEGVENFFEFIEERLQPMSIALDRLLLEQDLNEASRLWEKTFDGLQDPVAIFDSESQILRANKAFSENLAHIDTRSLFGETLLDKNKFFEIHSYPISLGSIGHPTNIINHYVDMTFAHALKKQMIQNEKMAAIGHMAGHIAHELNNPLTGVRSLAQILIGQTEPNTTLNKDLIEVESAAERCQVIIRNLIEFSSGDLQNQQVNILINEIVSRTLPLLKTLISHFQLVVDLTSEVAPVFVQPHLMQQVVFNIIKNAAQAMGDKGTLTIKTYLQNGRVHLSIHDSGGGIDPEVEAQIFDFFFTTKAHDQGTGLGLSMSKSIVDRFGGELKVVNQPGVGSEFIISLPLCESLPE